jgi:hypothetical protein
MATAVNKRPTACTSHCSLLKAVRPEQPTPVVNHFLLKKKCTLDPRPPSMSIAAAPRCTAKVLPLPLWRGPTLPQCPVPRLSQSDGRLDHQLRDLHTQALPDGLNVRLLPLQTSVLSCASAPYAVVAFQARPSPLLACLSFSGYSYHIVSGYSSLSDGGCLAPSSYTTAAAHLTRSLPNSSPNSIQL